MEKPKPETLEFLLQTDVVEELLPRIGKEQWQTLRLNADEPPHRFGVWCALLDDEAAARAMGHDTWDLMIGNGKPGFSQGWDQGQKVTTYHRFGSPDGVRPLVLYRSFHGAFPQYCEIDEEFRLYHDLAEDKVGGRLLAFDASGREIEVVRITPEEVKARLKYLRQFQAGTRLHLAVYIDSVRYSKLALGDIPAELRERVENDGTRRWRRNLGKADVVEGFQTFSRVLCKALLAPPPPHKAGIWPYEEDTDDKDVAFIIAVDENGDPVEHTSDPDTLANYFGANVGAPYYLTPVYFRREVLAKYFAEPERYRVSDGQLSCLGLWSCQIDNDLSSHVAVFLGDLGRDLPYEERLHWRQFNVAPEGGVSETNFRRSFLAEFTDAQSADLVFRHEYVALAQDWEAALGWPLFLPPAKGDAHLVDTIRIPVTNSQSELDEQVLHLTKLLVDSLNEKELAARAGVLKDGTKGLGKLSGFFDATHFPQGQSIVQFLRDLQALRSAGSGHRKGSAYDAIIAKLGIDMTRKPDAVRRLLAQASAALGAMRTHYLPNMTG